MCVTKQQEFGAVLTLLNLRCLVISPETKHICNCMEAEYGWWEDEFVFQSFFFFCIFSFFLPASTFTITLHSDCCSCLNLSLRRIPPKPFPWSWRAAYDSLAGTVSSWTKGILSYFNRINSDREAFWKAFRVAWDTVLVQSNPRDCSVKKQSLTFGCIVGIVCDHFSK